MRPITKHKRLGVGTQIALLYFTMIMIIGVGTYLDISLKTQGLRMSQNEVERRDFERDLENLTIIGDPFDEDRTLSVSVLNEGSVDTEVAYIAVYERGVQEPILPYSKLDNMLLQPYQYRTIDEIGDTYEPGPEENPTKYLIQLVTTRGSVFEHQYPRPIPAPKQIMKIYLGPFQFDFDQESFTYTSSGYSEQQSAWEMYDDETNIMFWVKITNYGEESIELNGLSYIQLIIHEAEGACEPPPPPSTAPAGCFESEVYFYLVDPESEPNNLELYDILAPIVVVPEETTYLKFAASQAFTSNFNLPTSPATGVLQGYGGHNNPPGTENLLWSYIAFYWKYLDTENVYGKTVPFASIHIKPYNLAGVVFNDANENEVQDLYEEGLFDVSINIYDDSDELIETLHSNENGEYNYELIPGEYRIEEINLPGYESTTPDEINIEVDETELEIVDFGDKEE